MRAIVVGAGIAGLAAAFRLKQAGYQVTVYEAGQRIGGRMSTERRDGHVMDLAATATSHKYGEMMALARDAGIADKIVPSSDMVGIPLRGEMQRIRSSKMIDLATTKLLPWSAKLKAAPLVLDAKKVAKKSKWYDLGAAGDVDVETAAEWVARRGHPEIDHAVFNALMRGAYLASSSTMSVLDLHFLINGFFGSPLFTFAGGLGSLPEALAGHVDTRLGARVTGVEEDGAGVRVSVVSGVTDSEVTESADVCVIAVPAPLMTTLYPQLPAAHREIAANADYVPLMTVKLLTDGRPEEKAMFLALPERESPELGALFLEHVKYADRSPSGKGQVGCFWDGRWNADEWETDDAVIVDKSIGAASRWLPGLEHMVESSQVVRWRHGVLNSRPGSYRDLHQMAVAQESAQRVFLAGDYFGGPSVNAALCSGEKAAERIVARHGGA